MSATIRDDTWHVLNMQQITPIGSTKNVIEPAWTSLEKTQTLSTSNERATT